MIHFIIKRLTRIFIISLLWLTIPTSYLLLPALQEVTNETKSKLSPSSVSVRGYYRRDGTYVESHSRRRPGGVDHDKPYVEKLFLLFIVKSIIVLSSLASIRWFILTSYKEIKDVKTKYQTFVEDYILSRMDNDFSDLIDKPNHLINRLISRYSTSKVYNCSTCNRIIKHEEFHYSSLHRRSPYKICINCMAKRSKLFAVELSYVWYFEERLIDYLDRFEKLHSYHFPKHKIDINNIEKHFYDSIKNLRIKNYPLKW